MKKLFLSFALILLLATSCSGPFNPFAESAGKEIFPALENQRLVYKVININSASYNSIDRVHYWYTGKAETYWGDSVWVLNKNALDTLGNTIWSYDNIYVGIDDFGYYSYSTDLNKEYPIKFLEFPVWEGKKWASNAGSEGSFYFNAYDTLEGVVEGKFSANGYDDCWRVKVTLFERSYNSGFKYEYIRWYKDGVGMVKDSEWIYDEYGYYTPAGVVLNLDSIIEE
ncbi:MAG: hypothetical protein PHW02_04740 [bacterium]|nr:hypothetical protein [bacterium]